MKSSVQLVATAICLVSCWQLAVSQDPEVAADQAPSDTFGLLTLMATVSTIIVATTGLILGLVWLIDSDDADADNEAEVDAGADAVADADADRLVF